MEYCSYFQCESSCHGLDSIIQDFHHILNSGPALCSIWVWISINWQSFKSLFSNSKRITKVGFLRESARRIVVKSIIILILIPAIVIDWNMLANILPIILVINSTLNILPAMIFVAMINVIPNILGECIIIATAIIIYGSGIPSLILDKWVVGISHWISARLIIDPYLSLLVQNLAIILLLGSLYR